MTTQRLLILGLSVATAVGAYAAPSLVEVSTGYNDEPRNNVTPFSPTSGQPVPWIGSPNTVFFGNPGLASSYDPDEDAILLQNLGATPVLLDAANIGAYNLFSLDGIGGPVPLLPGWSVILAGVDGSDTFSSLQTVGLVIDGSSLSYSDVKTADAPDGPLAGAMPWIGGAESIPWTPIYDPVQSSAPDAGSTMLLTGVALAGLGMIRRKL